MTKSCIYCGSENNLVEDPNFPGTFYCVNCLRRVERQSRAIAEGIEEDVSGEA